MAYDNLTDRGATSALIPEEVSKALLAAATAESAVLSSFPTVRMSRNQLRMPAQSAFASAYFVNGDTGLKQTSSTAWANRFLNAEEIAVILPIPDSVGADADFDIWANLQSEAASAIAEALDAAVLFGMNKPASWAPALADLAVDAGNTIVRGTNAANKGGISQDISDAFALVENGGFDAAAVMARRNYRGMLRTVRDGQGRLMAEVSPTQAYGVPIAYGAKGLWPTAGGSTELIVCDPSEVIVGVRQDMEFKILDQAVITDSTGQIIFNLAQQDMKALRVTFRVGYTIANRINREDRTGSSCPVSVITSPEA
jgi:HK97 family phage major capsid protein